MFFLFLSFFLLWVIGDEGFLTSYDLCVTFCVYRRTFQVVSTCIHVYNPCWTFRIFTVVEVSHVIPQATS